jgi:hypothetical protein
MLFVFVSSYVFSVYKIALVEDSIFKSGLNQPFLLFAILDVGEDVSYLHLCCVTERRRRNQGKLSSLIIHNHLPMASILPTDIRQ